MRPTCASIELTLRGTDDLAVFEFDLSGDSLRESKAPIALSDFHLKVYPNPSHGILTAEFENDASGYARLNVFDASGKIVFSRMVEVKEGANTFQLDLSSLNSGSYLLEEISGDERKALSFSIEK